MKWQVNLLNSRNRSILISSKTVFYMFKHTNWAEFNGTAVETDAVIVFLPRQILFFFTPNGVTLPVINAIWCANSWLQSPKAASSKGVIISICLVLLNVRLKPGTTSMMHHFVFCAGMNYVSLFRCFKPKLWNKMYNISHHTVTSTDLFIENNSVRREGKNKLRYLDFTAKLQIQTFSDAQSVTR